MPKVTSKLQLTVPKTIADQFGIRPGDELQWAAAGDAIRVTPLRKRQPWPGNAEREGAVGVLRPSQAAAATTAGENRQDRASSDRSALEAGGSVWPRFP
jgi:AbrB family looped-hinge helix DNA binding protein